MDAQERNLAAALLGEEVEFPAERRFICVSPHVLERYQGTYRSEFAGRPIDFEVEQTEQGLVAAFPLLPRAHLKPISERRFFTRLEGKDVVFEFMVEEEGARAGSIDVDWAGMPLHWPRVSVAS